MRYWILVLLLPLQGCLVFIPMGRIEDAVTGETGVTCVSETAQVGDRITTTRHGIGTIASLSGTSYRCKSYDYPIRARLVFN